MPPDLQKTYTEALQLHRSGQFEQAEKLYLQFLSAHPSHADCLHLLGLIGLQTNRPDLAVDRIGQAIALNPKNAAYHSNLGVAWRTKKEYAQAADSYETALALSPDDVGTLNNLGNLRVLDKKPDQAIPCFQRILDLKPSHVEASLGLGHCWQELGQWDQALAAYQAALGHNPNHAVLHLHLADALQSAHRLEEARQSYHDALALDPNSVQAAYHLGCLYQDQGKFAQAQERYAQALRIDPDYLAARWAQCLGLPGMGDGTTDLTAGLAALETLFTPDRLTEGHKLVGTHQPFYLAYTERNNKTVLARYGALCHRLMSPWQKPLAPAAPNGPIRVGIVSSHIHNHSVWIALIKGWLRHLNRQKFELHLFYPGELQDTETALAQSLSTSFTMGKRDLSEWIAAICGPRLDVLLYPEVGMDTMTAKLANLRLAPVQIASWGHPETTGLPTVDYYLSAENLEPEHAAANYTEKLIALPHLGCCWQSLNITPTPPNLGLDADIPILICPGAPFKYAPQFDWVFVEIVRRLGKCRLVFFISAQYAEMSHLLKIRLATAFRQGGLNLDDHVLFVPWLKLNDFYGLMQQADVYLDTIGFSGFNTAMQAVECHLPVVTRLGKFMRGRLASGILTRLGLAELIALTETDYVELAVKLVRDRTYAQAVRDRIKSGQHLLLDDAEPIRALEGFLLNLCRPINPLR